VEFTPWEQSVWDRNDTAGESGNTWHSTRMALSSGDPDRRAAEVTGRRAAEVTVEHHDTPTVTYFDALARPALVIATDGLGQTVATRSIFDIQGNVLEVIDARDNTAETRVYGMLGQVLDTTSVDGGDRKAVSDVLGQPLRFYDENGWVFWFQFDELRRTTHAWVKLVASRGGGQILVRNVYGEIATSPKTNNLRGRLLRQYDGAGLVEHLDFDFAGNELQTDRRLMQDATTTPDWVGLASATTLAALDTAHASLLDSSETFSTTATWDALGRRRRRTTGR
jgi:hypothetical protein